MRTLRIGMRGPDVEAWEFFLAGRQHYTADTDGVFDKHTEDATRAFQRYEGLQADGIPGPATFKAAEAKGFITAPDLSTDQSGPNWPPKPKAMRPLVSNVDRENIWGGFKYKHTPISGSRENITILGDWIPRNIVSVEIPQLAQVQYAPKKIQLHTKVVASALAMFRAWEDAGLIELVLTWGGSFAPRFIRGSSTSLSNHSYGTAFDINVPWNGLGARPALVGQKGSVRELVPIANDFGWYWGGHFTRLDGMHFEATPDIVA